MNGKFRHELKYLINKPEWASLQMRLAGIMQRDANAGPSGEYWIRSLYFDDYWNSAYAEKDMGILARKKYRIRIYECSDELIRLERKNKIGQYINKQSAPLTRAQADSIIGGDYAFMKHSPHTLLQEFYYECTTNIMRPRVVVDYDREPFVIDAGDVRITFDKHVRAGYQSTGAPNEFDIFNAGLPTLETLPADKLIMEVKFTEFLPKLVRGLLPLKSSELVAASKYVLCCDACMGARLGDRTRGLMRNGNQAVGWHGQLY